MPLDAVRRGALAAAALVLLGAAGAAPSFVEPVTAPRVAAPDTLRASVAAGGALVRTLPAEVGGAPVTGYAVLRGPALCGVAGRSLTWITRGVAPGTYDVRLRARHPDAAPDTLVLRVDVQP